MKASQRAEENPALELAVQKADVLRAPVGVFFGITEQFPEVNKRRCAIMLEGLSEWPATPAPPQYSGLSAHGNCYGTRDCLMLLGARWYDPVIGRFLTPYLTGCANASASYSRSNRRPRRGSVRRRTSHAPTAL